MLAKIFKLQKDETVTNEELMSLVDEAEEDGTLKEDESELVRSALEPRVVGRQLGINPLLTLAALYAGFRLWGVTGMILAPIITVTATQLAVKEE